MNFTVPQESSLAISLTGMVWRWTDQRLMLSHQWAYHSIPQRNVNGSLGSSTFTGDSAAGPLTLLLRARPRTLR